MSVQSVRARFTLARIANDERCRNDSPLVDMAVSQATWITLTRVVKHDVMSALDSDADI